MMDEILKKTIWNAVSIILNRSSGKDREDMQAAAAVFFDALIDLQSQDRGSFSEISFLLERDPPYEKELVLISDSLKLLVTYGLFDFYIYKECSGIIARGAEDLAERRTALRALETSTTLYQIKDAVIDCFVKTLAAEQFRENFRATNASSFNYYLEAARQSNPSKQMLVVCTDPMKQKEIPEGIKQSQLYKSAASFHPLLPSVIFGLDLEEKYFSRPGEPMNSRQLFKMNCDILSFNERMNGTGVALGICKSNRKDICPALFDIWVNQKEIIEELLSLDFLFGPMLQDGRTLYYVLREAHQPSEFTRFMIDKSNVIKSLGSKEDAMKIIQRIESTFLENRTRAQTIFSSKLCGFYRNYRKAKSPQSIFNYLKECYDRDPGILKFFERVFQYREGFEMDRYLPNFSDLKKIHSENRDLAVTLTSVEFLKLYGLSINARFRIKHTPAPCRLIGCDLKSLEDMAKQNSKMFKYLEQNIWQFSRILEIFRQATERKQWQCALDGHISLENIQSGGNSATSLEENTEPNINSASKDQVVAKPPKKNPNHFDFSKHTIDFGLIMHLGREGTKLMFSRVYKIKEILNETEFDLRFNRKDDWFASALKAACPEIRNMIEEYVLDRSHGGEEAEMGSEDEGGLESNTKLMINFINSEKVMTDRMRVLNIE